MASTLLYGLKEARRTNKKYSIGAFTDSGCEYLLKQYLLTVKLEPEFLEMCMLALGTKTLDIPPSDHELHEWVGRGLAYTCYINKPSGLGSDIMVMDAWGGADPKHVGQ
ncbi:hypothetical protein V8B97DRAFT_1914582 [Scleroderma yunnanense]